jgi:polyphosphate kinase
MNRNLDRRIETLIRVDDASHKDRINQLLDLYNSEEIKRWQMNGSGNWRFVGSRENGEFLMDIQEKLMEVSRARR